MDELKEDIAAFKKMQGELEAKHMGRRAKAFGINRQNFSSIFYNDLRRAHGNGHSFLGLISN